MSLEDTEVEISHWKKIVIHDSAKYKIDQLIKLLGIGIPPGGLAPPLNWAEGVLFRFGPFPSSQQVVKELLAGVVHWGVIEWAEMPKYTDVIVIEEPRIKIPIIDCSCSSVMKAVARRVKDSR